MDSILSPVADHVNLVKISPLERLLACYPPILESLLLNLPTSSIISLYHLTRYLRAFLESYPIAWKYLSFRIFKNPVTNGSNVPENPSSDAVLAKTRAENARRLTLMIVMPLGSRLCNLDLDNTLVNGATLISWVLPKQQATLAHLSVRGCKNVSLKYHITEYLTDYKQLKLAAVQRGKPVTGSQAGFALKSLYVYKTRHHRRRPYFHSSLHRTDSDAVPTHDLITVCLELGIWTDIGWCPTPGARCTRRKEYHHGRGSDSRNEIWMTFDRLWRSNNRIGADAFQKSLVSRKGLLWQEMESWTGGEPIGSNTIDGLESKFVPMHLRPSHKTYVENFKCADCGTSVPERCEDCSVKMHCMGCRKTLCASCAFAQPLPKPNSNASNSKSESNKADNESHRWWAPNEPTNPNIIQGSGPGDPNNVNGNTAARNTLTPKIQRCCHSQTQGVSATSFTISTSCMEKDQSCRLRTVPLPQGKGWEDPEIVRLRHDYRDDTTPPDQPPSYLAFPRTPSHKFMRYLLLASDLDPSEDQCPRLLCKDCTAVPGWYAHCGACPTKHCFRHDLRDERIRVCGYADVSTERMSAKRLLDAGQLVDRACQRNLLALAKNEDLFAAAAERYPHILKVQERSSAAGQSPARIKNQMEGDSPPLEDPTRVNSLCPSPDSQPPVPTEASPKECAPPLGDPKKAYSLLDQVSEATCIPELLDRVRAMVAANQLGPEFFLPKDPWIGCAKIFCPQFRPISDGRPPCGAQMMRCTECSVYVCHTCLAKQPSCTCTFCSGKYHCPACFPRIRGTLCKKVEEDEMKRRWKEGVSLADEMVEAVAEFLGPVFEQQEAVEAEREYIMNFTRHADSLI